MGRFDFQLKLGSWILMSRIELAELMAISMWIVFEKVATVAADEFNRVVAMHAAKVAERPKIRVGTAEFFELVYRHFPAPQGKVCFFDLVLRHLEIYLRFLLELCVMSQHVFNRIHEFLESRV